MKMICTSRTDRPSRLAKSSRSMLVGGLTDFSACDGNHQEELGRRTLGRCPNDVPRIVAAESEQI